MSLQCRVWLMMASGSVDAARWGRWRCGRSEQAGSAGRQAGRHASNACRLLTGVERQEAHQAGNLLGLPVAACRRRRMAGGWQAARGKRGKQSEQMERQGRQQCAANACMQLSPIPLPNPAAHVHTHPPALQLYVTKGGDSPRGMVARIMSSTSLPSSRLPSATPNTHTYSLSSAKTHPGGWLPGSCPRISCQWRQSCLQGREGGGRAGQQGGQE